MRGRALTFDQVVRQFVLLAISFGVSVSALAQEMKVSISPAQASIDVPVSWSIVDAVPNVEVTVVAAATDGSGSWRSEVTFIADADGTVDPARHAPISGSYVGIWPTGIIWTMVPEDQTSSRFNNHRDYTLHLSASIDGGVVATTETIRQSPRDGGRIMVSDLNRDGVVGRLWKPATVGNLPGILYIGGSGGGLNDTEAAQIAQDGFIVLDLLYFGPGFSGEGSESLPDNLVHVPIEYFGNAVTWLTDQQGVAGNHIGVYGHSRGTEAAVLVAAHYDIIKAVVVRSPSAVAWMGPGRAGFRKSAWTWQSRQVSFLNTGIRDGLSWLRKLSRGERVIVTRNMFEKPLSNSRRTQRALLPVDQIQAPILMISGKEDQQWPSDVMSELLIERLEQAEYPYEFRHVSFEDAGHRPGIPFSPLPIEARQTFANGGTARGNAQAGVEGLSQTRAFFTQHLIVDRKK